MNSFTTWLLTHIAKHAAWNFRRDRTLHQRQVLLVWYGIMRDALTAEVNDNSVVLLEMAQDAHERVWGRSL